MKGKKYNILKFNSNKIIRVADVVPIYTFSYLLPSFNTVSREKMAVTLAGFVRIGLPCATKLSRTSSRSARFGRVKMAVTLDEKKNFTLNKSEEAFNAAKVHFLFSFTFILPRPWNLSDCLVKLLFL